MIKSKLTFNYSVLTIIILVILVYGNSCKEPSCVIDERYENGNVKKEICVLNEKTDFIELAILMCTDALQRVESCGAQFREECPEGISITNIAEMNARYLKAKIFG